MNKAGRLAMRVEGEWWCAYYALASTMDEAIPLGRMRAVFAKVPARKQAFIGLMQEIVADLIQEQTGSRPMWNPDELSHPVEGKGGEGDGTAH